MSLICPICPRHCHLASGQTGNCKARANIDGQITALAYGRPCSIVLDPMEKKPLYHFFPGTSILSLGMAGCNLHCKNCQNSSISQHSPLEINNYDLPPEKLIEIMQANQINSVAYTYTEPLVAFEYVYDCARMVKQAGGYNVLVSAAYVELEPLSRLLPYIDAANIDLKSMQADFYQHNCHAQLEPVLRAIKLFQQSDVCLELTNLIIPGLNDKDQDFIDITNFVATELAPHVPLHFSRFFPSHKLDNLIPTPPETLYRAYQIAKEQGLKHIYLGNMPEKNTSTVCQACGYDLIIRQGYTIIENKLIHGACPNCQNTLYGRY